MADRNTVRLPPVNLTTVLTGLLSFVLLAAINEAFHSYRLLQDFKYEFATLLKQEKQLIKSAKEMSDRLETLDRRVLILEERQRNNAASGTGN